MKIKAILVATLFFIPFILSQQALADVVILDNQIIDGSQCVGLDCADAEAFGFDTLKLKTSDPVLSFVDTSTSAAFPTVDWSMGILDSATDTSFFFIKDATAGIDVLKLSASTNGGVALGANSELIDNTISVGSVGAERTVTHVAEGINMTDAVNVNQFNDFTTTAAAAASAELLAFDNELTTQEADLAALSIRLDDVVTRLNNLP